jgi:hypothetical protein
MTKKKSKRPKSIADIAWLYATNRRTKKAEKTWSVEERGTYWWGLYEGYQAGVKYGRRVK